MNAQPPPIASTADAIAEGRRALAGTRPGSCVVITPRVLQLLLDAAENKSEDTHG